MANIGSPLPRLPAKKGPDDPDDPAYQDEHAHEDYDPHPGQHGRQHGEYPENDGDDAEDGHLVATGFGCICKLIHNVLLSDSWVTFHEFLNLSDVLDVFSCQTHSSGLSPLRDRVTCTTPSEYSCFIGKPLRLNTANLPHENPDCPLFPN
jgi:hypothetical protein